MKISKIEKYIYIRGIIIIFLTLLIPFNIVKADMGPKPELQIIVENPPKEEYYLDLLVDYEVNNGYTWLDEEDYNQDKIKVFKEFRDGKWRPALLTKTRGPMNGELVGERDGNTVIHDFGYTLPQSFKIAILDSNNNITVSDEITLRYFRTIIKYDYVSKKISFETESSEMGLVRGNIIEMLSLKGLMLTIILTLIVEGIILLLFKFNIKENIKPFILINLLTQILLNIFLTLVVNKNDFGAFTFTLIILEFFITVIESFLFSKLLKGHTPKRRVVFSIVANIISFLSGYILYIFI
ncbi:hypothetical protein [Clostridium sp.]|uniref:hypothetical protein n=1 Tax=Clostridium sp. TaxID=1506 RepID=UPI001D8F1BE9|nr:hypothetical protein [Clostridium sp.]MBS5938031.1 hypothetical protein [Clostridium sp.]